MGVIREGFWKRRLLNQASKLGNPDWFAQWLERWPTGRRVKFSILDQERVPQLQVPKPWLPCRGQPIDVSQVDVSLSLLPPPPSPPLSLEINGKQYPPVRI